MPKRSPHGAGHVYRPTYRAADGTTREQKIWWLAFWHGGKLVRESAQTESKTEAEKIHRRVPGRPPRCQGQAGHDQPRAGRTAPRVAPGREVRSRRDPPVFELLRENNTRTGFFEREAFEAVRAKLPDWLKPVATFQYFTG